MERAERLDREVVQREPDRTAPVGVAAEQRRRRFPRLVVEAPVDAGEVAGNRAEGKLLPSSWREFCAAGSKPRHSRSSDDSQQDDTTRIRTALYFGRRGAWEREAVRSKAKAPQGQLPLDCENNARCSVAICRPTLRHQGGNLVLLLIWLTHSVIVSHPILSEEREEMDGARTQYFEAGSIRVCC